MRYISIISKTNIDYLYFSVKELHNYSITDQIYGIYLSNLQTLVFSKIQIQKLGEKRLGEGLGAVLQACL